MPIIDTDKSPSEPYGLKVHSHKKGGKVDLSKLDLYINPSQRKKEGIMGTELLERLEDKPVLNATVLDYLYEHQELIPDSWKEKAVYFWGTIYYDTSDDSPCVRCLRWHNGAWSHSDRWLDGSWGAWSPAAVSVSVDPQSSDDLDKAIQVVKEAGYKVIKEY